MLKAKGQWASAIKDSLSCTLDDKIIVSNAVEVSFEQKLIAFFSEFSVSMSHGKHGMVVECLVLKGSVRCTKILFISRFLGNKYLSMLNKTSLICVCVLYRHI